jgi:glycosyltransferase involved in cell wall biosynthesis
VVNYNQRYAFVTATPLDPVLGSGTAVAIMGLLAALDKKGKKVGLITPTALPLPPHLTRLWFNLHVPSVLTKLEVDTIVGFDCDGYRFARRKRQKRYVAYLHGVIGDELNNERGLVRWRLKQEANWERQNARSADLVIVPSDYSKTRAMECYGLDDRKVAVVPNGIDLDEWRMRLLPEHDRPRVLCVAKMYPRKGIDDLLNAWVHVRRSVPEAQLRIVGDGQEDTGYRQLASKLHGTDEAVVFAGPVRQSDLKSEYAACDIFCLPSRQEGFGIVYLEAMAIGRPVVGTTAGAIPEVIGDAGVLVPPRDPEALADALIQLLRSAPLRREYAAKARVRVERFSWSSSAQRFGELLSVL